MKKLITINVAISFFIQASDYTALKRHCFKALFVTECVLG